MNCQVLDKNIIILKICVVLVLISFICGSESQENPTPIINFQRDYKHNVPYLLSESREVNPSFNIVNQKVVPLLVHYLRRPQIIDNSNLNELPTQTSNSPTHPPNFTSSISIRPGLIQQPSQPQQETVVVSNGLILNKLCVKPKGQFPGRNCYSYVNCWDGVAIEETCPETLVFNPKGYCDYPKNVNCNGRPSVEGNPTLGYPTTLDPTLVPTLPPVKLGHSMLDKRCLKPRGQFPGDSCKNYVNCWEGLAVQQECPDGLLFSSNKGYCDYPHKVNCNYKEGPDVSINPENTEKSMDCPLEFGTFRDKHNCSVYFTCASGIVVSKYNCPEGLHFNDNIGVCDWNYRVDCNGKPSPHQPNRTLKPPTVLIPGVGEFKNNEICPSEFGTFGSERDCKGYFTCISRKVVAKYNCPEGFRFSRKLAVCDWSDKVECENVPSINNELLLDPQENFFNNIPFEAIQKLDKCKPGSVFRLNPQCTTAGICRDSLTEIIQCPKGLAYDSITDKCLPVFLAKC